MKHTTRLVAQALDLKYTAIWHPHTFDGELVLGKRAGLVARNHRRRAVRARLDVLLTPLEWLASLRS